MITFIVAAAVGLAPASAAPSAPSAPSPPRGSVDFDVQCMIATEQVTNGGKLDATAKSQLSLAMMFYFGRVDSAVSGDTLKAHIRAAAKQMEGRPLAPVLKGCGEYMTERGTAMESMGHSLEAEGAGSVK
jgi:hypothetical protein